MEREVRGTSELALLLQFRLTVVDSIHAGDTVLYCRYAYQRSSIVRFVTVISSLRAVATDCTTVCRYKFRPMRNTGQEDEKNKRDRQ